MLVSKQTNETRDTDTILVIGKVVGVFGVKGWVKIESYTAFREAIFSYVPWLIFKNQQWSEVKLITNRTHGKGLIAQLDSVNDRDQALILVGCDLGIYRTQLPETAADEFYWTDLIGLNVVTLEGVVLGKISYLFETGANDVVVVQGERERYLPWLMGSVIKSVSLEKKQVEVDWDPEF